MKVENVTWKRPLYIRKGFTQFHLKSFSPPVMALDANEAPEQNNSGTEDSPEHHVWALTTASLQRAPPPDSMGVQTNIQLKTTAPASKLLQSGEDGQEQISHFRCDHDKPSTADLVVLNCCPTSPFQKEQAERRAQPWPKRLGAGTAEALPSAGSADRRGLGSCKPLLFVLSRGVRVQRFL